jgi:Putative regulator of cell autolysis
MEPNKRLAMYITIVLENGILGLFNLPKLPFYILDFIYLVSLPLGLKIMQTFAKVRNQKTQLELHNTELELAFLKSQVNPHFLFNTLNNIYILVTDGDPKGADYVTKLSTIMHYLLHDSNLSIILLDAEIDFLKSYIELEKLRLNNAVKIQVGIDLDSHRYHIVPLILFPFIENAFKHGFRSSSHTSWLKVEIKAIDGILKMAVKNSISNIPKPIDYVGGIGLTNVKKRLDLNYKNNFKLDIEKDNESYRAFLELKLESID